MQVKYMEENKPKSGFPFLKGNHHDFAFTIVKLNMAVASEKILPIDYHHNYE
jgi:hypothetical protein